MILRLFKMKEYCWIKFSQKIGGFSLYYRVASAVILTLFRAEPPENGGRQQPPEGGVENDMCC